MKKEEKKPEVKAEEGKQVESQKKMSREDVKQPEKEEQLDIEMKAGDYRVQVHIMEAKDIKAKGKAGGGGFLAAIEGETADPMIEVELMGQSKVTDYKSGQLNPIFNEQMFFEFKNQTVDDLESGMIKISLMDHDFIGSNNLIGTFTCDLSYIYKMNKDHELYKMWVTMSDMSDETQAINAFVKITISVLGPGDKPPVHDPSKDVNNRNDNGVTRLFTPGRVKLSGHIVKFGLYRAEHLAPLDLISNTVDPYIKIAFAGNKAETKTFKQDRNPTINQELALACKMPCMNNKIKCEIWDDDLLTDKRVGTWYVNFKQIQNKTWGPRWVNLYGPPLTAEGPVADMMTKFGDKGSAYRGRVLYSVTTHDDENPKCQTKDLKFNFPANPSPSIPEKTYRLKIALYEGVELPDFDSFSIHVEVGPFQDTLGRRMKSKVVPNDNSRAVWNEYLDILFTAPETHEDIYDVIIYLAADHNNSTRACFKRLKAKDLLDVNKKKWQIEKYLLEEDKALDKLDDEQFPGIIQARIKIYSHDPEDEFPNDLFKGDDDYVDYLLQIHVYMGRDFPAADETGASDPFIIARCQGKKTKTKVKYETLNPGFFETIEMVVSLPPIGDSNYPQPGISLLVYDDDPGMFGGKKDLLGRVWIDIERKITQIVSPVDGKKYTVHTHKDPEWYDLIFDATNSKEGQVYVGYDLIPMEAKEAFPLDKINIKPPVIPGILSMAVIGMRDVIPSLNLLPVKKVFCKFDISGDTREPVITNKHPTSGGASNFLEVISLDIDVPTNISFSPVLTVYAYDASLGFLGNRLVGVCNIPLEKYCAKILRKLSKATSAFAAAGAGNPILENSGSVPILPSEVILKEKMLNIKNNSSVIIPKIETNANLIGKGETGVQKKIIGLNTNLFDSKDVSVHKSFEAIPDHHSSARRTVVSIDPKDADKAARDAKKKVQVEEYKKKVQEDSQKQQRETELAEEEKKQKITLVKKRSFPPGIGKFMKEQVDYDSQEDEQLDELPEWLEGRNTVEDELEDQLGPAPFDTWKIMRGQSRGKASFMSKTVQSTLECTGLFRDIIKLKDKSLTTSEVDKEFKDYITPRNVVVRLYVLQGKSLTPKDGNSSDPFLIIKLGTTLITDKESLRPKTCNPKFYRSYDITASLPGASTLQIECWDDDGFDFPDLIGITKIDLEDRFYNKDWLENYTGKKPIEERTLFAPKSSAPQGVLQCWLEILDPKDAGSTPRYDISPPPREDYELRVVIWGTRDCIFKDEATKCNDLYLKGWVGAGNEKVLETDTHWRCREKGSFNWRWKFPMKLPLDPDEDYGKDMLTIQMWDRDIIDANDLIGETKILLNDPQLFRMLDKVYKRKKKVVMKKKDAKGKMIERFWICVTNPEVTDKDGNFVPQGYAEISVEILPLGFASELDAGLGRDAPNQHPILPDPTGRFSFDLFSPWKMIKELLGPSLARKICCIVCCLGCCLIMLYWGFFLVGDIIGALVGVGLNKVSQAAK